MITHQPPSEFLKYLLEHSRTSPQDEQLPSLKEISAHLGISTSRLREQLEEAKALGLVEVRPRTGIRRLPYRFDQAVWRSLSFALALDSQLFYAFAELRKRVELSFWHQASALLSAEDHQELRQIIRAAESKLDGEPVQIPHQEHRQLHLAFFKRLENPFVQGILEAYWDAYESVGLSMVTSLAYLHDVWGYHRVMVDAVCDGDLEVGYQALEAHADLLRQADKPRQQENGTGALEAAQAVERVALPGS